MRKYSRTYVIGWNVMKKDRRKNALFVYIHEMSPILQSHHTILLFFFYSIFDSNANRYCLKMRVQFNKLPKIPFTHCAYLLFVFISIRFAVSTVLNIQCMGGIGYVCLRLCLSHQCWSFFSFFCCCRNASCRC